MQRYYFEISESVVSKSSGEGGELARVVREEAYSNLEGDFGSKLARTLFRIAVSFVYNPYVICQLFE